eukprot:2566048-Prymnesium_polylepis.1
MACIAACVSSLSLRFHAPLATASSQGFPSSPIPSLAARAPILFPFAQCARGYSQPQIPSLWLAPLFEIFT